MPRALWQLFAGLWLTTARGLRSVQTEDKLSAIEELRTHETERSAVRPPRRSHARHPTHHRARRASGEHALVHLSIAPCDFAPRCPRLRPTTAAATFPLPQELAEYAFPILLPMLKEERERVDVVRAVLECISQCLATDAGNSSDSKDHAFAVFTRVSAPRCWAPPEEPAACCCC